MKTDYDYDLTKAKPSAPREAKGGVFAPADIALMKKALTYYVNSPRGESTAAVQEEKQIANLLHRLNNRM